MSTTCYIAVLSGNGKLKQFGISPDLNEINLSTISDPGLVYNGICPQEFLEPVCIRTNSDIKLSHIPNYINGDLVILSENINPCPTDSIFSNLVTKTETDYELFPNLLGVNGSIYIIGTTFDKLDGFDCLRYVTGNIVIVNNINLERIPLFKNVRTIGVKQLPGSTGKIIIANNPKLKSIVGFEKLISIETGVYIMDNNRLEEICAFINLVSTQNLVLHNNQTLDSIYAFNSLTNVTNDLIITCNSAGGKFPFRFNAFNKLYNCGHIKIVANSNLVDPQLQNVLTAKNILIQNNPEMVAINLDCLIFIDNITVRSNDKLKNVFCKKLINISNNLIIANNNSMEKIIGFPIVRFIGGAIVIVQNNLLSEIKGFDALENIGSNLFALGIENELTCVQNNWSEHFMHDCRNHGDQQFTYDQPTESYILPPTFGSDICTAKYVKLCNISNPPLNTTRDPLTNYSGSIIIYDNPMLLMINMCSSLLSVCSHIYIINNAILDSICAFDCVKNLLDIYIRNNPAIRVIRGFNELRRCRDFILAETLILELFVGLKNLKSAQHLYLQSKVANAIIGQNKSANVAGLLLTN